MPNTALFHPVNGTRSFGQVPPSNSRGAIISGGEIRLLRGKHTGPNKGFGARHIWAEHLKEMAAIGLHAEDEVPHYVASIVRTGIPLYFSGDSFRHVRLMAVRASAGTAILEYRYQRDTSFWSVVTAYSANKKHGTLVGSVL